MKKQILGLFLCIALLITCVIPASADTVVLKTAGLEGVRAPLVGETAGANLSSVRLPVGAHYTIRLCYWYNFTDEIQLSDDDAFMAGKEYGLRMRLIQDNGYAFDPEIQMTLNGDADLVRQKATMFNEDGHVVFYSTYFLATAGSRNIDIYMLDVENFVGPVIGQTAGDNLLAMTTYTDYEYGKVVKTEKWYWYNETDKKEMAAEDTFAAGKTYTFHGEFTPAKGYAFTKNISLTLSQSGENVDPDATNKATDSCRLVSKAMTPKGGISRVEVTGWQEPQKGQTAAQCLNLSYPEGEHYFLEEAFWYDEQNERQFLDDAAFLNTWMAYLCLYITPESGYVILPDATVTLNESTELVTDRWGCGESLSFCSPDCRIGGAPYGDLDLNDRVDAADALLVLKSAVHRIELLPLQAIAADVDGDGSANAADALQILKRAVHRIDHFPVEETEE